VVRFRLSLSRADKQPGRSRPSAKDEMPNVSADPTEKTTDTPEATPDPTAGFAEALAGIGNPPEPEGSSAPAKAVDGTESKDKPEVKADKAVPPAEAEEKPPETAKVNFDGFSDTQKATWERLLKLGHATPEEVEEARKDSLRQSAFTKKTMALAKEREAWDAEKAAKKEDLEILAKIHANPALHAAWLKAARGELESATEGGDELVDRHTVEETVDRRLAAREAEREARSAAEQKAYDDRMGTFRDMVKETMTTLGIDQPAMVAYLQEEEKRLPEGTDPILHYEPQMLRLLLETRHEATLAKAEAAKWREQVSKRTSADARTAKQSLPPARRVAQNGAQSPLEATEAALGLDPEWSMVRGLGHRGGAS
jgi:hypothetical protein